MRSTLRTLAAIGFTFWANSAAFADRGLPKGVVSRAIDDLRAGDPAAALSRLELMLRKFGPNASPGVNSGKSLAAPLLYRAIAEYELGRLRDARWSWHMALVFDPDIGGLDMGSLGAAGEFLAENRPLDPGDEVLGKFTEPPHKVGLADGVRAPVLRKRGQSPEYGEGLRRSRIEGSLTVLVRIDENGMPDSPRAVSDGPRSGFWYSMLEALRTWEFEPAQIEDKPVAVWYTFETTYKLQ